MKWNERSQDQYEACQWRFWLKFVCRYVSGKCREYYLSLCICVNPISTHRTTFVWRLRIQINILNFANWENNNKIIVFVIEHWKMCWDKLISIDIQQLKHFYYRKRNESFIIVCNVYFISVNSNSSSKSHFNNMKRNQRKKTDKNLQIDSLRSDRSFVRVCVL